MQLLTTIRAHDQFFRTVMADLNIAREFFTLFLPEDLFKSVNLESLELQPSSYINAVRKESTIDLLYRVKQPSSNGFLYLIVEHQSTADVMMPLRINKYECNVIDHHAKNSKIIKSVPLVYSIVIYHARPYPYSIDIRDLVNSPPKLVKRYVPPSRFRLLDLGQIDDALINKSSCMGIMIYMLKHIFERDLIPYIHEIINNLKILYESGCRNFVSIVLQYAMERGEIGDLKAFYELVTSRISTEEGGTIMTLGERLRAEGRLEGRTEGRNDGRNEEKFIIAARLLAKGADPVFVAEITALSLEQIKEIQSESAH